MRTICCSENVPRLPFHVYGCKGEFNQYITSKPKKSSFFIDIVRNMIKFRYLNGLKYIVSSTWKTQREGNLTKQTVNFSQLFIP